MELKYNNKFFWKYKWRLSAGVLFVVASNFFKVYEPRIVREAIDLVVDNLQVYNSLAGAENIQASFAASIGYKLLLFGALVIGLSILTGVFLYFTRQTIIVMSRLIEYDIRKEMFDKYEKLDQAFYKRNNTGDLMSRISEDVSKIRMYIGPVILYGLNLTSLLVLVTYSMLSVSLTLTLWSLLPLPFLSISIYYVSSRINKRSTKIQEQLASLNNVAQEVYSGIRVVKSYVQEKTMGKSFSDDSELFKEKSMGLAKIDALFFPLMVLLIGISTIITVFVGGIEVVRGNISPGNIAEFVIYVNMLTWPVTAIGWIASIVQQAEASQKRINAFLDTEPLVENSPDGFTGVNGKVVFDKVSFKYPDTGIVALQNISFTLEPGQKMAIVGKTGSGKTTIADLIVRMYDATSGSIKINDTDIKEYNLNALRDKVGYVPQDVYLFSNTIKANLAFGTEISDQPTLEKYAQYASIDKEIKDLPNGYETLVGERGVTLSGGQKQRITIARALIKKPEIVLLDDCLSAVDVNTEQQILSYLQNELSDKTTIIITHRIYSLLAFDKIIVLEDGVIKDSGTHEELLQNEGFYTEMYEKQQLEEHSIKS